MDENTSLTCPLLPHATLALFFLVPPSNLAMITKSLSLSLLMEAVRCGAAASWMSMAARDGAYPYTLG